VAHLQNTGPCPLRSINGVLPVLRRCSNRADPIGLKFRLPASQRSTSRLHACSVCMLDRAVQTETALRKLQDACQRPIWPDVATVSKAREYKRMLVPLCHLDCPNNNNNHLPTSSPLQSRTLYSIQKLPRIHQLTPCRRLQRHSTSVSPKSSRMIS
jgi:hypothetical protein